MHSGRRNRLESTIRAAAQAKTQELALAKAWFPSRASGRATQDARAQLHDDDDALIKPFGIDPEISPPFPPQNLAPFFFVGLKFRWKVINDADLATMLIKA